MSQLKRFTRFPPEPNGYLHLGHLKAMMFDFDLHENCSCTLRMDDTNPEAEKQEYVDAIVEDVNWLGYKYSNLTYTSDYFDQLIDCAIELIKQNDAYVDFTSPDLIKDMRHNGVESEFRAKSVEWNLEEFTDMLNGKYEENICVLRLKIDMQNNNHSLRDPIAYRVKKTPHYRTGIKYCIYPSYDYSHGLVDALEQITDSYCTMEFYVRREQYYWPADRLSVYLLNMGKKKATVREFGRLNIEGIVLSKRKIIPLVEKKIISGFDDPRLYTIRGLRRRGFTPEILKNIVKHVTESGINSHETLLSRSIIDYELRNYFDKKCHRVFGVMDPIRLVNSTENYNKQCTHPNHPTDLNMGSHTTTLTKDIFIEKTDFREIDDPNYYRLAPNKTIRLRYADFVQYISHNDTYVTVCDIVPDKPKKIKGVIHWVNYESPKALFEVYGSLYNQDGTINMGTKITTHEGYIEQYVLDNINLKSPLNELVFQFERLGYFKFDRFQDNLPVFIMVIDLVDKYNK
jgi:glutaminyl-tRNA synthetase